ncbi:Protein asteroid 1 [Lobosporangium transversale]|nr:Protein asteroid 1 [Lobosporangium transversale]
MVALGGGNIVSIRGKDEWVDKQEKRKAVVYDLCPSMGVLGLYSYFECRSLGIRKSWVSPDEPSISEQQQQGQQKTEQRRYFILDGNAYIHHLYCGQFEWIWGGQYSSFVSLLIAHISALTACGFRLQFLFDGPLPLQKLQTRLNRDTEKIHKMSRVMNDLEHYHASGLYNRGVGGNESNDTLLSSHGLAAAHSLAGIGLASASAPGTSGARTGSRSSSNFLIPPLVMEVTLQTLRSLDVDLLVCEGEADGLVAQLAMEKSMDEGVEEAYAVSKDSDYFIYNTGSSTKGGYIPLDTFYTSKNPETSAITITATVYSQSVIANHLGIRPEFLPLFASLTGNDYLRPDVFEGQIAKSLASATGQKLSTASNTNHARIKATAGFLKQYGAGFDGTKGSPIPAIPRADNDFVFSKEQTDKVMERILEDRIHLYPAETSERRHELRSLLKESIQQYVPIIQSNTGTLFSPLSSSFASTPSSEVMFHKIKDAFRTGQFSFKLMDVVCNKMFWCTPFLEDVNRESAWLVSREMRRWVYGILACSLFSKLGSDHDDKDEKGSLLDVVEYVRRGDHLSAEIVTGVSSLELDEMLRTAQAKEAIRKTKPSIYAMDVNTSSAASATDDLHSVYQGKAETMSIDIPFNEFDNDMNSQNSISKNELDQASRTSLFLGILGADTDNIRSLPKPFMALAATLRYLINALAHSKTRSTSIPIANFEVIAIVASVLFLREKYYPETIPSEFSAPSEHQDTNILTTNSKMLTTAITPKSAPSSSSFGFDETPPLTKRSLYLSTQYQHTLGTVSLLANSLQLEDMIPPLATLFDGLLFQQTLALARGGTLLEQRMIYQESIDLYHRILAAVEEGFIDTGEIDVVVVFRAPAGSRKNQQQQQQQQQQRRVSLGIFGPEVKPVNQLPSATPLASGSSSASSWSIKTTKSSAIQKKSSGSSKRRIGNGSGGRNGGNNNTRGSGGSSGSSGGNMFNVLALGCEF